MERREEERKRWVREGEKEEGGKIEKETKKRKEEIMEMSLLSQVWKPFSRVVLKDSQTSVQLFIPLPKESHFDRPVVELRKNF